MNGEAIQDEPKTESEGKGSEPVRPSYYTPILSDRPVGRLELLVGMPPVSSRVARVFVLDSGELVEHSVRHQPTTRELLRHRFRTLYEVDLAKHVTQIEAELPSKGDMFAFRATIDLIWCVREACKVVRDGITDIREAVTPLLLARLRGVTRNYGIGESEAAEAAANEALGDRTLGTEFGLAVRAFVRLTMDAPSLEQAETNRRVAHFHAIINSGDFNQFALQLAIRPDDIGSVVTSLFNGRDSHRKALFDFVTRLLESGALDRWQVDDHVRTSLQWLRTSIHNVLSGTDESRPSVFGENIREPVGASRNGSHPT
ncbi:hypothetical protein [Kutzneria albida]|uniref:Uncharacterized protein n=1 Tax=Kutzneria albida DSM 43870 TaxID=1449976 RepID=W5WJV6_9PSEU|nr:hypothetical protein [Kutzneria albida]AHI01026.1 hypothetical protein KALB_7668 [Kutzneria albida DSM 43870]